jgi:cyclic pyranopterin phosphate synthase
MIAVPAGNGPQSLSLRISVTDRCQLRCKYCMPPDGVAFRSHEDIMRYEEIVTFTRLLSRIAPLVKVRLTGGEPLVRSGIERLVAMLADLHIPDLALTTNGQSLAAHAAALKAAGLVRVNVSLDSLNERTYRNLSCGGVLGRTLEGISEALRCGLSPLKLNMVVMRGVNDSEILDMVDFAAGQGAEIRFLEVMPIGTAMEHYREWFVSSADVKSTIQTRYHLAPIPRESGSTCRSFLVGNGTGNLQQVGFISACSEPFCHDCRRLRLTSDGRLLGCLATDIGISVRALLSSGPGGLRQLEASTAEIFREKRARNAFRQLQLMAAIGG